MEREEFVSGYCRQLDASRMVEVLVVDGQLDEVDCGYFSCVYRPNCQIAQRIDEIAQAEM
ncbi:MAG: hypothetical protein IJ375_07675 [Oscillospiraceae bacterium]|nr:hypothetical protein [Oscillospiraceae bacterium]